MTLFDLPATAPHPARFTSAHLGVLIDALEGYERVLDPFAGVGTIHRLRQHGHVTVGVELEPEWAAQHPGTLMGDARRLPFVNGWFDAIATSPTFGNRHADHHESRDGSVRHTYRHYLGRPLTAGNSGGLAWGRRYRDFHTAAWAEATRVVCPGGRFVLNIKDHVRDGRVVEVMAWHDACLRSLGWRPVERIELRSRGLAHGQNHDVRVEAEYLLIFDA
jgi:tRNA G10  N-methylase Trm11